MYWAYIALPSPTYSSYTRISLKTYHNISVSLSVMGNDSPPVDKSNFLLIKYTSYLFPLIKQFFLGIFPSLFFPPSPPPPLHLLRNNASWEVKGGKRHLSGQTIGLVLTHCTLYPIPVIHIVKMIIFCMVPLLTTYTILYNYPKYAV